jgi:hypothetical protein
MGQISWLIRHGVLFEKGSPEEIASRRSREQRSDLATPNIIRDAISGGAVQSQADGKEYESRSALYRAYKDQGVRIVEPGEKPVDYAAERPKITKDEIGEALQKVKQGYKPAPLEEAGPDELPEAEGPGDE